MTIEQLFEIFKTMSEEDWNILYKEAENKTIQDSDLVLNWNAQYDELDSDAVIAFNQLYKLVEAGRVSELSESVQKMIQEWNK